ncbi:MAG TPA: hypothetical protein VLB73_03585 [Patescibacteria group bacterium]|nr:hypothetical protein [Patescibacteria group bacterium]
MTEADHPYNPQHDPVDPCHGGKDIPVHRSNVNGKGPEVLERFVPYDSKRKTHNPQRQGVPSTN